MLQASKYPEMQGKLVEEINCVFGHLNDKHITQNDLGKITELKFMDRFIKETLRLYTAGPFFERELSNECHIGNYKLPKRTGILIFAYGVHHDQRYFPNPETFDPDRFLPENFCKIHPYAYIPFSAGPRNCIGKNNKKIIILFDSCLFSYF